MYAIRLFFSSLIELIRDPYLIAELRYEKGFYSRARAAAQSGYDRILEAHTAERSASRAFSSLVDDYRAENTAQRAAMSVMSDLVMERDQAIYAFMDEREAFKASLSAASELVSHYVLAARTLTEAGIDLTIDADTGEATLEIGEAVQMAVLMQLSDPEDFEAAMADEPRENDGEPTALPALSESLSAA